MKLFTHWSSRDWAWLLWGIFILFVIINRSQSPVGHAEVFVTYRNAARMWLDAQPLYDGSAFGFVYLPHAAIFMTPFIWLTPLLDSFLWRLVDIGVFALGVFQFARLAEARNGRPLFLPVTVISILMAASAAKLGQMTLIMSGLLMIALSDLGNEHPWRAAFWLVLAVALKPLAAVLLLLVAALYPRTIIPLLIWCGAVLALPFLLQDPEYVWHQYVAGALTMKQASGFDNEKPFADLFWMLRAAGIEIADTPQFLLRLLFATVTLAYCWWLRRKLAPLTFLVYLFTLAACYVLLFNPRTENNTYAIMAPALGVFTAWAFQNGGVFHRLAYSSVVAGYLFSNRIGKLLTGGYATIWIKPLLCGVFVILVLYQAHVDSKREQALGSRT